MTDSEVRPIVLTGLDRSGHLLLVIPLDRVRSDLTTLSTLIYSRTFGQVRADEGAEALLNTSLECWAQRLQQEDDELAELSLEEVIAARAGDDDPFPDATEFFGWDWDGWRPEPRLVTATWLEEAAPEVLRWLGRPDDGWGFSYEPSLWLHPDDQRQMVRLLVQRGYEVTPWPGLAASYDDPPLAVDHVLACAGGRSSRPH